MTSIKIISLPIALTKETRKWTNWQEKQQIMNKRRQQSLK